MPPKRKAGCSFCRLRHMKCDNAKPACSNCAKRTRECVYDSALRIRLSTFKQEVESAQQSNQKREKLAPWLYSPKFMIHDRVCMQLFEFYKANAAKYMDFGNDGHHFGDSVVAMSLTCPMLYYACIAYAAAVWKRVDAQSFTPEMEQCEQKYLGECYQLLIPALNNRQCLAEPPLLTSTVILRAGEQFQFEDAPSEDPKHHLKGSFSLVADDRIWQLSGTGVREASFWTYLRQDIHAAVLNRMPCVYSNNHNLQFFSLGSDSIWSNRITFILTRACNYAFGAKQTQSTREPIVKQVHDWMAALPRSFEKIHESEGVFPTILYLHPWHTLALQYYYFALVLLEEGDLVTNARRLIGICVSASDSGLRLNCCHMLEFAAMHVTSEEERQVLIDFFQSVSRDTGWPTARTFNVLSKTWNLEL